MNKYIGALIGVASLAPIMAVAQAPATSTAPPAAPAARPAGPDITALVVKMKYNPSILTIDRPEGRPKGSPVVSSPSLAATNGVLPLKFGGGRDGGSISPEVVWTPGPPGTKSYVLAYEDGSAGQNREGIQHWMAFNIPADMTRIPEGASVKDLGFQGKLGTAKEARNVDGKPSYTGPGGANGNPYRLQILALDTMLALPNDATRLDVWAAMKGHVLASGSTPTYYRSTTYSLPPQGSPASNLDSISTQFIMINSPVFTIDRPQGQAKSKTLTVSAPSFAAWGPPNLVPQRYTVQGEGVSPNLAWSKGPATTKSYVVVMEDAFANKNRAAFLHWAVYDIPATALQLPEGRSGKAGLGKEGANSFGGVGYQPLKGIPVVPGRYHIEVFALDKVLGLPAGASHAELLKAMSGHVVSNGMMEAYFQPLRSAKLDPVYLEQ